MPHSITWERRGFPRAGTAAPRDFPHASPSGNPSEQPCHPTENPVHPSSFTWINPFHSQEIIINVTIKLSRRDNLVSSKILSRFFCCTLQQSQISQAEPGKWLKVMNRNHHTQYLVHFCSGQCSRVHCSTEQGCTVQTNTVKYSAV